MNPRFPILFLAVALGAGCLDPGASGNLVPKTVTEDPTLPQLQVAGTHLHAEIFGPAGAPTVITLHGGPGADHRSILPLEALANDGYKVVFWDQRGAGLSERHDADTYTMTSYLEDLRHVIEQTASPGQPFVFIGHSWGAMFATWFINEHGDYGGRLKGAILSEPGAFTSKQLDEFLDRVGRSFDLAGEQINDILWSEQFLSAEDHARADYQRTMMAMRGLPGEHRDLANMPPLWRIGAVVNAKLLSMAKDEGIDFTTHLKSFNHHVLFLRGELNEAAPLWHQQQLASSFADAEVITIPGAPHELIWANTDAYLAHARAYFNAIGFTGVSP